MILVDTSVWIDHLRSDDARLADLLNNARVFVHPHVVGELACGELRRRREILEALHDLPQASVATDDEVLAFIERWRLMGRGLGYIDVHLLASVFLTQALLWTRDKRLAESARNLGLEFVPEL